MSRQLGDDKLLLLLEKRIRKDFLTRLHSPQNLRDQLMSRGITLTDCEESELNAILHSKGRCDANRFLLSVLRRKANWLPKLKECLRAERVGEGDLADIIDREIEYLNTHPDHSSESDCSASGTFRPRNSPLFQGQTVPDGGGVARSQQTSSNSCPKPIHKTTNPSLSVTKQIPADLCPGPENRYVNLKIPVSSSSNSGDSEHQKPKVNPHGMASRYVPFDDPEGVYEAVFEPNEEYELFDPHSYTDSDTQSMSDGYLHPTPIAFDSNSSSSDGVQKLRPASTSPLVPRSGSSLVKPINMATTPKTVIARKQPIQTTNGTSRNVNNIDRGSVEKERYVNMPSSSKGISHKQSSHVHSFSPTKTVYVDAKSLGPRSDDTKPINSGPDFIDCRITERNEVGPKAFQNREGRNVQEAENVSYSIAEAFPEHGSRDGKPTPNNVSSNWILRAPEESPENGNRNRSRASLSATSSKKSQDAPKQIKQVSTKAEPEPNFTKPEVDSELSSLPAYQAHFDDVVVEKKLERRPDGCYIVWFYEEEKRPAITVKYRGELKTFLIYKRQSHAGLMYYIFSEQKESYTLRELVCYHVNAGVRVSYREVIQLQTPVV